DQASRSKRLMFSWQRVVAGIARMCKSLAGTISVAALCIAASPAAAECFLDSNATMAIGIRNMDDNCSGAYYDRCYDAAALFIRVNGKLLDCPEVDRARLRGELTRARRIIAAIRQQSPGAEARSAERAREYNAPRGPEAFRRAHPTVSTCPGGLRFNG